MQNLAGGGGRCDVSCGSGACPIGSGHDVCPCWSGSQMPLAEVTAVKPSGHSVGQGTELTSLLLSDNASMVAERARVASGTAVHGRWLRFDPLP
jgi:hypothetical protein